MTLAEAIIAVEDQFIVHHEIGQPVDHYDEQKSKTIPAGARDMSRAPCGEKYIALTSAGIDDVYGIMFHDEARAIRWWVYAVEDYAGSICTESEWPKLHLYWRDLPVFERHVYLATDQPAILQGASTMPLTVSLGTVKSKLLISKLGPDGTED